MLISSCPSVKSIEHQTDTNISINTVLARAKQSTGYRLFSVELEVKIWICATRCAQWGKYQRWVQLYCFYLPFKQWFRCYWANGDLNNDSFLPLVKSAWSSGRLCWVFSFGLCESLGDLYLLTVSLHEPLKSWKKKCCIVAFLTNFIVFLWLVTEKDVR